MGSAAVSRYALLAVACIVVAGLAHAGESVTVPGEVFGPDGVPADGVPIWAVYSSVEHTRAVAEAVTGDAGRFSLTLLVDDPFEPVALIARTQNLGDFLELLPGQEALIQLQDPIAVNTGVVRDPAGEPIEGASVALQWYVTTRRITAVDISGMLPNLFLAVTDADGRFALTDYEHSLVRSLRARADGYAPARRSCAPFGPEDADIFLQPGRRLSGRTTHNGEPVEGVVVVARPQWGQRDVSGGNGVTDAEGRYELCGLTPGVFNITVAPVLGLVAPAVEGIVIDGNESPGVPDIELQPCGFIRGKAVDTSTGAPVGGFRIRYSNAANPSSSGGAPAPAFTDDDGRYEIKAPTGTTKLHAYPMGVRGQAYKSDWESTELEVTAGHVVDAPVLQLERAPNRMRDGWRDEPRAARPGEIILSLKLEEDSRRVSAYEPVVGIVEMTNQAEEAVRIYRSDTLTTRIQVRDPRGRLAAATERPIMPLDVLCIWDTLQPGETVSRRFLFSAVHAFSEPGEYELRVQQLQFEEYFPLLAEGAATLVVEPFDAGRLQARCEELMQTPERNTKILYSLRHDIALPYLEKMAHMWQPEYSCRAMRRIDSEAARAMLEKLSAEGGKVARGVESSAELPLEVSMWDIEIDWRG